MPNPIISQIQLPVDVEGTLVNTTFDIQDAGARELIEQIGHALYWIGVTTTALTDGDTTNPITVNSESVTARLGGMASYDGSEFVWNGSAWQELGKNNFGALAFKSSASGSFTPSGAVTVTPSQAADTTTAIVGLSSTGSAAAFSVSNEVLTITPGSAPTAAASVDVVTASGAVTATAAFVGTEGTVTVS